MVQDAYLTGNVTECVAAQRLGICGWWYGGVSYLRMRTPPPPKVDNRMPFSPHTMHTKDRDALLSTLDLRFHANMRRHPGIAWSDVRGRVEGNPAAVHALREMEATGGEPDVVLLDDHTAEYTFCDCAAESPIGRRSGCYDQEALDSRKENKPAHSAVAMAAGMGITLLTEAEYRALQAAGAFDLKTSSWISTPANIRALGGALFCDRRYDTVFLYHNGASSYYAARGFRGVLRV